MVNIKMNINDGWFYGGLNYRAVTAKDDRPLVRMPFSPKVQWSEGPLVQRPASSKVRQLICIFVFAYADCCFSHAEAHF